HCPIALQSNCNKHFDWMYREFLMPDHRPSPNAGSGDSCTGMVLATRKPKVASKNPAGLDSRYADATTIAKLKKQPPRMIRWRCDLISIMSSSSSTSSINSFDWPLATCLGASWVHSKTFPCMSNKPKSFGLSTPAE